MFIQEDDLKLNDWQFSQRKYLPYKVKKTLAERRIKEWYYNWDGQVYLSYSGGLDSTALLHMIRKTVGLEVPAVFSNTGLEFPEIVRFARQASGEFVEIYPRWKDGSRLTFKQVVEKYGFPLISKETALKIRKLRHGNLSDRYRNYLMNGDEECHILGQRKMKVLDANTSMLIQVAMYMMEKQLRASRLVLGQGRMCLDT